MLEKCCSFMTQTNVSLPGDLELVQSMVQFPIALTSTEAVHTLRYTNLTHVSLELKFDVFGSTLQLCFLLSLSGGWDSRYYDFIHQCPLQRLSCGAYPFWSSDQLCCNDRQRISSSRFTEILRLIDHHSEYMYIKKSQNHIK